MDRKPSDMQQSTSGVKGEAESRLAALMLKAGPESRFPDARASRPDQPCHASREHVFGSEPGTSSK